jgi:methyl-accepting chemotaxis protein
MFSRIAFRTKLTLLVVLGALGMVAVIMTSASILHQRMVEDRIDKLRAVVTSTRSVAEGLVAQAADGRITPEQAMARLRDTIHTIRYDGGAGYVVADTFDGITAIHGTNPALEGKPSPKDAATGRPIADLEREAIASGDDGEMSYLFPRPGQSRPERKVVAIGRYAPLQLIFLAGAYTDDLDAQYRAALERVGTTGGAILVVTLFAAWLVNRDIAALLKSLNAVMTRLAKGDLAVVIPVTGRRDEIGGMARAVLVFKDSMIETGRLRAEQEEAKLRSAAEHKGALNRLADSFESKVGRLVQTLSTASIELEATAKSMTGTASQSNRQAAAVAAAAAEASTGLQTVASATEELTASIGEISRQVAQSSNITRKAVDDAKHTGTIVQALADGAEKIGAVVGMITNIASKTNLLALNATIEAARAGDAGKGFAVVASEVKSLAGQTGKATDEISRQIAQIQGATRDVVAAIRRICGTIEEVGVIATTIASAVEEQGAATAEIARNVQQTSQAAQEVTVSINSVSHASNDTGAAAGLVLAAACDLSKQAGQLTGEVNAFVAGVRAA